jgi:hypothetical protein
MMFDLNGNTNALMELIAKNAHGKNEAARSDLQDNLIAVARKGGLSDEAIKKALYSTWDGPVFYYP